MTESVNATQNAETQPTAQPTPAPTPTPQAQSTPTPTAPQPSGEVGTAQGTDDLMDAYNPSKEPPGTNQNQESSNQANPNDAPQPEQAEPEKPTLPERYELKDAEGNDLAPELNETYQTAFKELGLTAEQAQKAYEIYNEQNKQWIQELQQKAQQQRTDWLNEVKADPELGGQNFANTKMNIGRVMQRYGSQELRDYLNQSGLGYNPQFVKFINKLGADLGNDTLIASGRAPSEQEYAETLRKLYDHSPRLN